MALSSRKKLLLGLISSPWWLIGSLPHLDFAYGRAYGSPDYAALLSLTRASASYTDDLGGNWSSDASGLLRRRDRGLKLEQATTNSVRNNSMQGAAAGTPGTLPTNWIAGLAGLSQQIVGTGTDAGIDYIDMRFFGTTNATEVAIQCETSTQIVVASGQTWTGSLFVKLVGGSLTNITATRCRLREADGVGSVLRADYGTSITPNSSWQRVTATATMAASTLRLNNGPALAVNNAAAVDVTLRFGWPQLEQLAVPTSPIRTTNAAISRSADDVTIPRAEGMVSLAQGSAFVDCEDVLGASGTLRYLWINRVDANNYLALYIGTDNKVHFIVVNGGVTQCDLVSTNAVTSSSRFKAAVRWSANDFALRVTSALGSPANDNSGTLPTGTPVFSVGQDGANANYLNGFLRQLALFLTPQNDNRLAAMVA